MIQFKTGGSIKDVDIKKRIVTGYFTNTGSLDSDQDIFEKGAFQKTIAEWGPGGKNRIWHLWMHDAYDPIAKPKVLKENDKGVYFETEIPDTPTGQKALVLYESGDLSEHSVGFNTIKYEDDIEKGIRTIKEVRMWEGSSVLWGANENTPTTAIKSDELMQRVEGLNKLLKSGNFVDEVYQLLQIEIESLKGAIASLEPAKTTPAEDKPDRERFDITNLIKQLS